MHLPLIISVHSRVVAEESCDWNKFRTGAVLDESCGPQHACLAPGLDLRLGFLGSRGVDPQVVGDILHLRRNGETAARFVDNTHDPQQYVLLNAEEFTPVARLRESEDFD